MKKQPDFENMSIFEQVLEGLNDGIAHTRGELNLKTTTLPAPAPTLSKARVAAIRKRTGMSQAVFARYLNVPTKTLQSWEQGARTPKAGEARLLQFFDVAPEQIVRIVIEAEQNHTPARGRRSVQPRAKTRD